MTVTAIHQMPRGFLWGCATASHQVEGGNANDWWRWEHAPGRIFQNQIAGKACEWWAGRYLEDFDRAADIHNNTHRFSIEWSRIEPEPGKWDAYSLARYLHMCKALRDRGMTPMVTLHHFTNPLWFTDQGGWLWDEAPERFARFVRKVVEVLGAQCSLWCTLNEPNVLAIQGYVYGVWPPGVRDRNAAYRVLANLLRAHARAYHTIKEVQPQSQVGFAPHLIHFTPRLPALIHSRALRLVDGLFNRMLINACRDGVARFPLGPRVTIPHLKGALDWIGVQYYRHYEIGFNLLKPAVLFLDQGNPPGIPAGPATWGGLSPSAIFTIIEWVWKTLGVPIFVTEAGVPDPDDTIRPGYLVETIRAVWKAVNFNYPVSGFFHWSLVDNFEWAEGYDPRYNFGLFRVNRDTQARTARSSAALYAEICGQNGLSSDTVARHTPQLFPTLFPGAAGLHDVRLKSPGSATR
jgi:beta-glucosidase